tara:strand:+ start:8702 stop:9013 length:312 start_codon:yes stop_codon:yes gene_type:complete
MSRENPRYAATPQGMRQFTEEEEVARDAEIKEWADGANDRLAAEHRNTRNELLTSSDWTQMPDSPLTDEAKTSWATYRQALRDLPTHENWNSLTDDDFPEKPV